jgi:hypothetical protein
VQVLFQGNVDVHYRFVNVHAAEHLVRWEFGEECYGQVNGLCGAGVSGVLCLVTGLHTGAVGFTVELHSDEPPLDDPWEDVVEVSFITAEERLGLHGFDTLYPFNLPPGQYRVRYCVRGMDRGHYEENHTEDDEVVDFYLLQFWPAPIAADRILRQTSQAAAYWHRARTNRSLRCPGFDGGYDLCIPSSSSGGRS